jgi:hypothetical protein
MEARQHTYRVTPRWLRLTWALPLVLVPTRSDWFAILVAPLGLYLLLWRRESPLFGVGFLLFALLGAVSQLVELPRAALQPLWIPIGIMAEQTKDPTKNLIPWYSLKGLYGWVPGVGVGAYAERQPEGFWRVWRIDPKKGVQISEIAVEQYYPVHAGGLYTESFYFRHDGTISFDINFYTQTGNHLVPARIVALRDGLFRAYASYQFSPKDQWVRAISLARLRGDWSYLEIAAPQLEVGPTPTTYQYSPSSVLSRLERAGWWVSMALLGLTVLHGSRFLLCYTGGLYAGSAVLVGLFIQVGVATFQRAHASVYSGGRVAGLTPEANPNFLGHLGLIDGGLVWVLTGTVLGGIALGAALGLTWLSETRATLPALAPLVGAWWAGLPAWARGGILAALIVGGLAMLMGVRPELGRLSTILDPGYSTNLARVEIWKVALQAFKEYPLVGVGHQGFSGYYFVHTPSNVYPPYVGHAHNVLLHVAAEAGLLGLAGFLTLWGTVALWLFRLRQWSVLVLLISALVLNLFDYTWFYAGVYYPLWVAVAWALTMPSKSDSSPPGTMRG